MPAVTEAIFCCDTSSARRKASLNAAATRSSSMSLSSPTRLGSSHVVFTAHRDLDRAGARLAFDFGGGQLILHALHVLLHLLRLLHQACHLAFHHDVFSVSLSLRGRIEVGSTDAPKFSINSRTKGSA